MLIIARRYSAAALRRIPERLGLAKNILTVRLAHWSIQGILKLAPASDGSAYQDIC